MMVHVRLHGIMRDRLPAEAKGRAELDLAKDATVQDVIAHFHLDGHLEAAVNEEVTDDWGRPLTEGDVIDVFRPAAGG